MFQLFASENQFDDNRFYFKEEQYHQLFRVQRIRVKEALDIVTPTYRYTVEIAEINNNFIVCKIVEKCVIEKEKVKIILYQSLPKQDKMATIIDHTVQSGVSEIIPVITERSVVKWDQSKKEKHVKRWQEKAYSAACQAKRDHVPVVHPVCSFDDFLKTVATSNISNFVAWEEAPQDCLFAKYNKLKNDTVGIFIGPEGGLSFGEVELLKDHSFQLVSLGKTILRVEIAGLFLIAQLHVGDY
ncbi:hypothetical protein DID76_01745 [Candidatus Marinamargulisbacteria bacterium SCGC AG-414-C22]|nr:hypothetical protein DID76_01745 [Candidatus Marinamargulisbacteria bacterium SCGC AG-414-C22]